MCNMQSNKKNTRFACFDIKFTRPGYKRLASNVMSTSVLKALPANLEIKRH